MKKTILFLISALCINCNSTNKTSHSGVLNGTSTNCPDDGNCSIILHKNKKLNVITDEIGSKYFQLLENKETSVVIFEYRKKVDENLQDGNYIEEVIFEISNNVNSLNLNDNELQTTKMIYGRHCYCKGQAGYFNVINGNLILNKVNDEIKFRLNFKINEVPQIITSITENIK